MIDLVDEGRLSRAIYRRRRISLRAGVRGQYVNDIDTIEVKADLECVMSLQNRMYARTSGSLKD